MSETEFRTPTSLPLTAGRTALPHQLLQAPIFQCLPYEQATELAAQSTVHSCSRGTVLVEQGTTGRDLIVLLEGIAHVIRKDPQGREVILRVLKNGAIAGDLSLIDNQPHSATIRCIKSCHVMITPGQALAASLARQPYPLTDALLKHLSSRLRVAHRHVATLALFDVPDRVHRQLFDLGTELADGSREVCDRLSQQDIARMVGASREMVGRALAQLELRGTVKREDGRFIVANSLPE